MIITFFCGKGNNDYVKTCPTLYVIGVVLFLPPFSIGFFLRRFFECWLVFFTVHRLGLGDTPCRGLNVLLRYHLP